MQLPNFFIVGAAKAGTTSLWRYLLQHPDIFMPSDIMYKEPAYFSDIKGLKSLDDYAALFSGVTTEKMIGEASTAYLTSPESPVRIKNMIPDAKIIIMLRNPIDRAYSLYNWMACNGYEPIENFESALEAEVRSRNGSDTFKHSAPEYYYNYLYFFSGLYSEQIMRYLDIFSREQLFFIIFEKFKANVKKEVEKIFTFLGVDSSIIPEFKIHNTGNTPYSAPLQFYIRQELSQYLRPPYSNPHPLRNEIVAKLMKLNTQAKKPQPVNESIRKVLREKYFPDVRKTSDLIGQNLSNRWTEFKKQPSSETRPAHPEEHSFGIDHDGGNRSNFNISSKRSVTPKLSLLDQPVSLEDLLGPENQASESEILNGFSSAEKNSVITSQTPILKSHSLKKSFKVVHICTHDFGGAGKAAYRLHKGLQKIDIDSTMLVMNKKSKDLSVKVIPDLFSTDRIECDTPPIYNSELYIQQKNRWKTLISKYPQHSDYLELFTDALSGTKLDCLKEIQEADILNFHWIAGTIDFSNLPKVLLDKPIIWTLHDMNPFTGGCHYTDTCKKYEDECKACPQLGSSKDSDLASYIWEQKAGAYQKLYINAVAPSRWLGECASRSKLFNRFHVNTIPYGFPTDIFKPHPKAEIRQALNIPEEAKVILFGAASVNNLRKGFKYLVEALGKISPPAASEIIVLTFGGFSENIQALSMYPIYALGSIEDEFQLSLAYNAADVFVLPSLQDNHPNTIIEAMACGVPVVGFDVGGIPDMIEHKKTGFLAKPKSALSLVEGIEWVLSSPERHTQLSEKCRARVESRYALEIQARAYTQLYRRISENHQNKSKNLEKLLQTGEEFFHDGKLDEAKIKFGEALVIDGKNAMIHNNLAVVHHKQNDREKAKIHYLKATELAPDNMVFQKKLADFYFAELGRFDDAIKIYVNILKENPNDVATLLILGHTCAALENHKDAIHFYQRVLKIEPLNEYAKGSLNRLKDTTCDSCELQSHGDPYQDILQHRAKG